MGAILHVFVLLFLVSFDQLYLLVLVCLLAKCGKGLMSKVPFLSPDMVVFFYFCLCG